MADRIRLLTFSTLYPNEVQPRHGIFVETRLRQLLKDPTIEARVIAPVPWFPFRSPAFGRYAGFAKVPRQEMRHSIEVHHPRYPLLPKIGMNISPLLLAAASMPHLRRMIREGYDFDLIDAHYFYPDGVAAVMLGRHFRKPVVITARGSDINLIPEYNIPRRMILRAANQAAGLITVSRALKEKLSELGVDPEKITVLRNGIDLEFFRPTLRDETRAAMKTCKHLLLSVGNLVPFKGHDIAIRALAKLQDTHLNIIGEGSERQALQELASGLGVADRVTFLGNLPQSELPRHYSAADALILASSREGWANVLLEAMACGTPVVATRVGGNPEVVATPAAGQLMDERTTDELIVSLRRLFATQPSRDETREYAGRFGWEETSLGQRALFEKILASTFS